jgi:hypothetical protein
LKPAENLPVAVNTSLAAIEAGATARIGKCRCLAGALHHLYFGVEPRRSFRETHRATDVKINDIGHKAHLLPGLLEHNRMELKEKSA